MHAEFATRQLDATPEGHALTIRGPFMADYRFYIPSRSMGVAMIVHHIRLHVLLVHLR